FTFAALASPGRDIRFDLGRVEGYRNFCNKLWNAARFVLMQTEQVDLDGDAELSLADRWIISRLQRIEAEVMQHFDSYRFDLASQQLHDFVWHSFCDWYLELVKPVLNSNTSTAAQKTGTSRTLLRVLEALLRLMHPLMPFITEEIWQRVAPLARGEALAAAGESISTQPYPRADDSRIDAEAETQAQWLQDVIMGLRQIRGEMDIAPSQSIPLLVANASTADLQQLHAHRAVIDFLARTESIEAVDAAQAPISATALVGDMQLLVPMAGLIDQTAELARLDKQLAKLDKEINGTRARLSNPSFVDKAPADVVAGARAQAERAEREHAELTAQRERIAALPEQA